MNTETSTSVDRIVELRANALQAVLEARLAYAAYVAEMETATDWREDLKDEQRMGLGDLARAFRRIS